MPISVPPFLYRHRRFVVGLSAVLALVAVIAVVRFAFLVRAFRAHRAVGSSWSFPSRVYSDGVTLSNGQLVPREYLLAELAARGYRRVASAPTEPGTYATRGDAFDVVLRGTPDVPDPAGSGGPEHVRVQIANGRVVRSERLGGVPGAAPPDAKHDPRLEPMLIAIVFDESRIWRTWVSLKRVPEPVRDAIVASEDRRFYSHGGFDVRATLRALNANVRSGGVRQGGSTITQQLARGLFLGRERTMSRKLAEIPLAVGLELVLSKNDILEMYLNSVYWGQAEGFGVGGIEEAARWYFDAPVESLRVLEGATLAAMIPAPNEIQPFVRPDVVLERRNRVLRDLVETHKLSESEAARLAQEPLDVRRGPRPVERFPSFSGYVAQVVDRQLSRHAATSFGLSIFTTMDLAWQTRAEVEITAGLASLDGGASRRLQGAFVALEPTTSAVRAMVGGRRQHPGDFNRAFQARRQTGSAIKPIVYATAFESANNFTPATTISDSARTFGRGRSAWTPKNFDGSQHPEVTLAGALERSLNIATTNLVDHIGPDEVARAAERFGLGKLKAVPSIGLGSNEVSLISLTNAFAVFGHRGLLSEPSPIRVGVDHTGRAVLTPPVRSSTVIPEGIAALMTGLLENVVRYGVGYPLRATYGFDRPVAGKTGTTDDFKDAWFVGFTPDIVAGVWVGYDQPRSIGRQAAHTAIPVWARTVKSLLAGFPPTPFAIDASLEWRDIDPWNGYLADSTCIAETTPFLRGTAPISYCSAGNYGVEPLENPDSLYADSTWMTAPDTFGVAPADTATIEEPEAPPDTSEVEPQR
jgi:penicillin-binding protein 1B